MIRTWSHALSDGERDRYAEGFEDGSNGAVEALSACVYVLENRANATRDPEAWEKLAVAALAAARDAIPSSDLSKETR
jgi:hypothetical protein